MLKGRARQSKVMWSRRAQDYQAKINSGDPRVVAEVVRDLGRNAVAGGQSFSERQLYEAALDRLACEVAAVESVDKEFRRRQDHRPSRCGCRLTSQPDRFACSRTQTGRGLLGPVRQGGCSS